MDCGLWTVDRGPWIVEDEGRVWVEEDAGAEPRSERLLLWCGVVCVGAVAGRQLLVG